MKLQRVRAIFGVGKYDIVGLLARAQAMHDGMAGDPTDYASANPPLPAFLTLIQNLSTANQAVGNRTIGAAANRDVQRDLLYTGMESEKTVVQVLADANRARAVTLIQNAGLLIAKSNAHAKALLALRLGTPIGTVICEANVSLLVATLSKPSQGKFFNWQSTIDGGKTFQDAPSTPVGMTTIHGFAPLTTVGVRVSMTTAKEGTTPWTDVVTILVH
jgi:hypothetical protein